MGGLGDHLRRRIALDGPLTVAQYMADVLGHPEHGYYMNRDPLGAGGDFVTAPEVSQMFGELIGLWCAVAWRAMGEPGAVTLVELGPGRGTLITDILRAARPVPGFLDALGVHLVETSPALSALQRQALAAAEPDLEATWHQDMSGIPEGPLLLIANEFFDALPIRQYQRTGEGWSERMVDHDREGGGFRFVLQPLPGTPLLAHPALAHPALASAPAGSVVEVCPAAIGLAHSIGERLAGGGGAALIVDYGHTESAIGDTLQAVRDHAYHHVLEDPGTADLTAHVDFQALARAAAEGGAHAFDAVPQGEFLGRLGIAERAEALLAKATPDQAEAITAALHRLTDGDEMGTLFKVLALTHPDLPPPPGFD